LESALDNRTAKKLRAAEDKQPHGFTIAKENNLRG
jgi:hypothetical protein